MTQSSGAITAYLGGLGDGDSILSISRERGRLTRSIERAAGEDTGDPGRSR